MPAKASKGRKKGKKIEIPVYAQVSLTVDDLVQDSFEGKIGDFTREQQKQLRGLRRTLKNRVNVTFQSAVL